MAVTLASSCRRRSRSASVIAARGSTPRRVQQSQQRVVVVGCELQRVVAAALDAGLLDAKAGFHVGAGDHGGAQPGDHGAERGAERLHGRLRRLRPQLRHASAAQEGDQQPVLARRQGWRVRRRWVGACGRRDERVRTRS